MACWLDIKSLTHVFFPWISSICYSIYFFIWLCRVLVAACRIFVAVCGIFCCGMWDLLLRHAGFRAHGLSSCGTWALEHVGSVVAACGLSWPVECGILVPRPGIEPASPALEGGFLTTGPPGKSLFLYFFWNKVQRQSFLSHLGDLIFWLDAQKIFFFSCKVQKFSENIPWHSSFWIDFPRY